MAARGIALGTVAVCGDSEEDTAAVDGVVGLTDALIAVWGLAGGCEILQTRTKCTRGVTVKTAGWATGSSPPSTSRDWF